MRNALLVVILVATAACGAYRLPGSGNGSGQVSGQVVTSPCGPVEEAACVLPNLPVCYPNVPIGNPCGPRQIPSVELVFTNGSTKLSTATDSRGAYSIELPSGTWTVATSSIMRIVSGPRTLVVSAGASIVANYVVDSGITAGSQPGSAADAPTPAELGAQFRTTER